MYLKSIPKLICLLWYVIIKSHNSSIKRQHYGVCGFESFTLGKLKGLYFLMIIICRSRIPCGKGSIVYIEITHRLLFIVRFAPSSASLNNNLKTVFCAAVRYVD